MTSVVLVSMAEYSFGLKDWAIGDCKLWIVVLSLIIGIRDCMLWIVVWSLVMGIRDCMLWITVLSLIMGIRDCILWITVLSLIIGIRDCILWIVVLSLIMGIRLPFALSVSVWRRHYIAVTLARLVTELFLQRDGKATIHRSNNILRGGVHSTSCIVHAHTAMEKFYSGLR
jgi:hypothetical protein